MKSSKIIIVCVLILTAAFSGGCGQLEITRPNPTTASTNILPTATKNISTPTSEPVAAIVNGRGIPLILYKVQLNQFKDAAISTGKTFTSEEASKIVLEKITDDILLSLEAEKAGHVIDNAAIQAKIDGFIKSMGNKETLMQWQKLYGYDELSFKEDIKLSLMATWMRDQIIKQVPDIAEQVNARQILVLDQGLADRIYSQLQSGGNFETLAYQYDPQLGGNLGWFPRGYLTVPELENAAFQLEAGQYSPVIPTTFGFQIIQVIERDPQRKLAPDAKITLQRKAIKDWMEDIRSKSKIEILVKVG